ncbi:hypothetical protein [Acinetobacter sp. ABJ_C5_2]|uniref:hypothetical protein n=1 Tax=Acinetobacter sp. ABJ_C5_2 TaxID=3376992 RepID=UPI0037CBA022
MTALLFFLKMAYLLQEAIKLALNGDVIAIPDGCQGTCRADPELQVETWKFDPSLKLSL